uniref:valine--tRNA ligase n=1 Tax=Timema poppense TaxID=170557 RepID=A0A7R9DBG7_TIMPO|nr:unnamed protein product [Timema poppensis]
MRGEQVLWVPGTDHAGISTQVIVEKKLLKERGLTRHDLGREQFLQEVWKWREDKSRAIKEQLRKLGASLDWSRETFTMDAKQCDAVKEAFMRLFEAGLVYRANSLVNWSCVLQSAISDIEVEHRHFSGSTLCKVPGYDDPVEFGVISDFAYKLCDRDGEIVVSTTRIETMLGDVAVAVHPSDTRYTHLQGVHLWHPFQHRKIPLIFDEVVDINFGTGAVKITPAHDMIDLEVSKRHGLDSISVITEEGRMESNCGVYSGMKRFEARSKLLEDLHTLKLFRGKRDHSVQVPFCTRSEDVVELLLKPQWFIRCKQMAEEAAAAVQDGQLQLEPAYTEKIWYNWLYNNRDWCVSRQLWWGHRIPMYHCQIKDKSTRPHELWVAALSEDHARKKATLQLHLDDNQVHKLIVVQDEDVLDTWFSSALFPFSALGWPDQDQDYRQFYPLSVLETGHDILFFWVARMVMLGARLTHQIPFQSDALNHAATEADLKQY